KALNEQSTAGKIRLYHYNSFPYFHASVADGHLSEGRMFIAHYLYGISRANAPGLELLKSQNPRLFDKYWTSVRQLIRGAKEITD
ncbi:MAG: hypothetical protein AAGD05_14240, partial [Bacteroidota bacterium]